jgi:hypothetical protein
MTYYYTYEQKETLANRSDNGVRTALHYTTAEEGVWENPGDMEWEFWGQNSLQVFHYITVAQLHVSPTDKAP